ncbi:hypothetical protein FN846DRAFT_614554 [Sphaerosporella brunnea]|uniref:DUF7079 domain-containing protein n=1 Tax=Sphaerosporella brunnea TaxID=1250544 RepID=A0A5J5EC67_9PEZI|nr:hypothetical protein FN846DRAFT_614554 [Sphaerosporella brunnea]
MRPEEQQACIVLSMLFLDTELGEFDLSWMTNDLQHLSLDEVALTNLLRYDVFPVLWHNIIALTGEWQWFDSAWLLAKIVSRRRSWLRFVTAPGQALA